jgi:hypothetical protein
MTTKTEKLIQQYLNGLRVKMHGQHTGMLARILKRIRRRARKGDELAIAFMKKKNDFETKLRMRETMFRPETQPRYPSIARYDTPATNAQPTSSAPEQPSEPAKFRLNIGKQNA